MEENQKNQDNKKENVFEETFGDLLNGEEPKKNNVVMPKANETLEDTLFTEEAKELTPEQMEQAAQDYIPPSIGDDKWEQFVSRTPLPPLTRDQEARAVSIGLQEVAKIKQYMMYVHRHMMNEFTKIYSIFPLAVSKDFDEVFGKAHKEMAAILEDVENLVAGNIDRVEAVKANFQLHQSYEEKRLSILYDLLEHYNNKK
ncbi:hypothetical protein COJ01_17595 [Priestia megaterium]|uniref:hypothetical protein n=1 Tax=Priestia megaterium TaxID=1404 RepID=UPI000BF8F926|nr:hypothetical protein [Priestia megaterium]PFK99877.1 hypothetical protein COJ01_17595 [Priestia megaterium]